MVIQAIAKWHHFFALIQVTDLKYLGENRNKKEQILTEIDISFIIFNH